MSKEMEQSVDWDWLCPQHKKIVIAHVVESVCRIFLKSWCHKYNVALKELKQEKLRKALEKKAEKLAEKKLADMKLLDKMKAIASSSQHVNNHQTVTNCIEKGIIYANENQTEIFQHNEMDNSQIKVLQNIKTSFIQAGNKTEESNGKITINGNKNGNNDKNSNHLNSTASTVSRTAFIDNLVKFDNHEIHNYEMGKEETSSSYLNADATVKYRSRRRIIFENKDVRMHPFQDGKRKSPDDITTNMNESMAKKNNLQMKKKGSDKIPSAVGEIMKTTFKENQVNVFMREEIDIPVIRWNPSSQRYESA